MSVGWDSRFDVYFVSIDVKKDHLYEPERPHLFQMNDLPTPLTLLPLRTYSTLLPWDPLFIAFCIGFARAETAWGSAPVAMPSSKCFKIMTSQNTWDDLWKSFKSIFKSLLSARNINVLISLPASLLFKVYYVCMAVFECFLGYQFTM